MRIVFPILLGVLVVAGCGSGTETEKEPATVANTTDPVVPKEANELGAKIFQTQCMSCHSAQNESGKAPPIFGVKDHVIKAYPDREAFIKRVASWIKAPNANDVLMPGAVGKFGLMPAMPQLTDNEAQTVAAFLFDTNLSEPDWYKAHYQAEHGKTP